MISKIMLMTFLTAIITSVHGQDFYDTLQTEANLKYDCSFKYYNIDSLNHVFFESGNVKMQIDSTAKYQVMFAKSNSWCSGPNCIDQIFQLDTLMEYKETRDEEGLAQIRIPMKKHYHCSKTYGGVDLIKNTEINFSDALFNYFPSVVNNQDKYNGKWTVFSNEKYLVFRLARVYIGNSSWGSDKYIYLKKVI
ncbi:MAG: hypothetical protein ACPGLV_08300 [Bacteroidia bacterium]